MSAWQCSLLQEIVERGFRVGDGIEKEATLCAGWACACEQGWSTLYRILVFSLQAENPELVRDRHSAGYRKTKTYLMGPKERMNL